VFSGKKTGNVIQSLCNSRHRRQFCTNPLISGALNQPNYNVRTYTGTRPHARSHSKVSMLPYARHAY